jgi:hypothetical protein
MGVVETVWVDERVPCGFAQCRGLIVGAYPQPMKLSKWVLQHDGQRFAHMTVLSSICCMRQVKGTFWNEMQSSVVAMVVDVRVL